MTWPPQDPEGTYRHRALRVGITLPLVLALAMRVGPHASVAFAAFGVVASLSLADFGGTTLRRAGAYATLGAIGLVNIVIGTLCSSHVVAGMAAALLVGALARLIGVFGGYWGMGTLAALLAFVLAVTTEAGVDELPARLGGWAFGCAAATLAALVLWPRHERHDFERLAADAAQALAALLRDRCAAPPDSSGATAAGTAEAGGSDDLVAAVHQAVDATRRWLTTTPYRPAGPSAGDRALVDVALLLSRGQHVAAQVDVASGAGPSAAELLRATAAQLDLAADYLLGHADATLVARTAALSDTRSGFVDAIHTWIAQLDEAGPDELHEVESAFHALLMSRLAEELTLAVTVFDGGDATAVAQAIGHEPRPPGWFREAAQILLSHLSPRSAWFRECLRTGIGLCAAVGVAMATGIDHGFWIVLGTLSVLRSSARATSTTAVRAVTGTVIGFVLSAILVELTSGSDVALWILLPFLAAGGVFVAGAMNDIWGQAGFTLLVVTLFDIIAPANWEVGLVRVETVAIGAAVSIVVGLLVWPRGATEVVRDDLASYFGTVARLLRLTVDAAPSGQRPDGLDDALASERRSHRRASQAFGEYLGESPAHQLRWAVWARLLFVPSYTSFACRLLTRDLLTGRPSPWPDAAELLRSWGDGLAHTMTSMRDRLEAASGTPAAAQAPSTAAGSAGSRPPATPALQLTDADLLHCLGSGSPSTELAGAAVALAWARCWIADLDEITASADAPLGYVVTHVPSSRWSWSRTRPAPPAETDAEIGDMGSGPGSTDGRSGADGSSHSR